MIKIKENGEPIVVFEKASLATKILYILNKILTLVGVKLVRLKSQRKYSKKEVRAWAKEVYGEDRNPSVFFEEGSDTIVLHNPHYVLGTIEDLQIREGDFQYEGRYNTDTQIDLYKAGEFKPNEKAMRKG